MARNCNFSKRENPDFKKEGTKMKPRNGNQYTLGDMLHTQDKLRKTRGTPEEKEDLFSQESSHTENIGRVITLGWLIKLALGVAILLLCFLTYGCDVVDLGYISKHHTAPTEVSEWNEINLGLGCARYYTSDLHPPGSRYGGQVYHNSLGGVSAKIYSDFALRRFEINPDIDLTVYLQAGLISGYTEYYDLPFTPYGALPLTASFFNRYELSLYHFPGEVTALSVGLRF